MKERDIQKQILEYLTLKGIFHYRNNTGAMKTLHGFVRFGTPGSPDIFAVKDGMIYGIEIKGPAGRMRPEQVTFGKNLVEAGGTYLVAKSLDDILAIL